MWNKKKGEITVFCHDKKEGNFRKIKVTWLFTG